MRIPIVATVLAAIALAACSSNSSSGRSAASEGSTVAVSLQNDSVTLSPDSIAAGDITFSATNNGSMTHEIEVFTGDVDPSTLPIENNVASTEGLTLVNEIEDITPGMTTDLDVNLTPGTYVVMCNLPGHFAAGMHGVLTVT